MTPRWYRLIAGLVGCLAVVPAAWCDSSDSVPATPQSITIGVFFTPGTGAEWKLHEVDPAFQKVTELADQYFSASHLSFAVTYAKEVDEAGRPLPMPSTGAGETAYLHEQLARTHTEGAYFIEVPAGPTELKDIVETQLGVMRQAISEGIRMQDCTLRMTGHVPQTDPSGLPQRKRLSSNASPSPITLKAQAGEHAEFLKNGSLLPSQWRGISIAVLNEVTGEAEDFRHYDTWYPYAKGSIQPLIQEYVNGILPGRIVMMATTDYNHFSEDTLQVLRASFGVKVTAETSGWDEWVLIAKKGGAIPFAERWSGNIDYPPKHQDTTVEAVVPLVPTTDRQPPTGVIAINGGAATADTAEAQIDLSRVTDGGSGLIPGGKMQFSNDGIHWSVPEDFNVQRRWNLTHGSGPRVVSVKVRDHDGNWSGIITSRIELRDPVRLQTVVHEDKTRSEWDPQDSCSTPDGHMYLAYWKDNYYIRASSDYGATWPIESLVFKGSEFSGMTITCDANGHVYALGNTLNTFRSAKQVPFNLSSDYGKTWLPQPLILSATAPSAETRSPQFCQDGRGNAYALWVQSPAESDSSEPDRLLLNVSHDHGRAWLGQPIELSSSPDIHSGLDDSPRLVCNGREETYVTWTEYQQDGWTWRLRASYDAGRSWPSNSKFDPVGTALRQLTADESGHVYLAWVQDYGVWVRLSSDRGNSWTPPIRLSGDMNGEGGMVDTGDLWRTRKGALHLKTDQRGHVYVFWLDLRETLTYPFSRAIYFNRSHDYGKTWLKQDVRINTNPYVLTGSIYGMLDVERPQVVVGDNGVVGVAWKDQRSYYAGEGSADIFLNYSTDFGDTWLARDLKISSADSTASLSNPMPFLLTNRLYVSWQEYSSSSLIQDVYLGSLGVLPGANQPPVIDSVVKTGTGYTVQASDPDPKDTLTLTARLANGDPLPASFVFSVNATNTSGTVVVDPTKASAGEHLVTFVVTDAGGLSATRTETIVVAPPPPTTAAPGMSVVWTNAQGVSVQGSTITKTAADGWGNGGAASVQVIPADGGVQFRVTDLNRPVMAGLSQINADAGYATIQYGLYVYFGGALQVYENGQFRGSFGSATLTDRLSVVRAGTTIRYAKNGVVFYTSLVAVPRVPLLVDSALYTTGGTIADATFIAATATLPTTEAVRWGDAVGVVSAEGLLVKTAAEGWGNAGAASIQRMAADGAVAFQTFGTDRALMCGLSATNRSASYDTIQYALYLRFNEVQVYENGVPRGSFGSFSPGDRFSVERSGTAISYKKNGVTFYTSTVPSTGPLLVDAAIYTQWGFLTDVTVTGASP